MKTPVVARGTIRWGVFEDKDGDLKLVSPRFRRKREAQDHLRAKSLENARVIKIADRPWGPR